MNCRNCGGLTAPDATGSIRRCRYCESVHFLGPGDGPDGLSLFGTETDVECPRGCGPLLTGHLDGHDVVGCPACRGVLIRSEEFAPFIRDRRKRFLGAELLPRPIDPESLHRAADCPECGYRMETHPYYGPGNCVIDSCARCRLVWLDSGEIAAIEQAPGRR